MSFHEKLHALKRDEKLPELDLTPIKKVLGELTPRLSCSPVGRIRLIRALKHKYGENYRTFEAASEALSYFDAETEHLKTYIRLKGQRHG